MTNCDRAEKPEPEDQPDENHRRSERITPLTIKGRLVESDPDPASRASRGNTPRLLREIDIEPLNRSAFQAVQFGHGRTKGDLGRQLAHAGVFEVFLGIQNEAAGGETGFETGQLKFVLASGELGGLPIDLHALKARFDGADGGTNLDEK